MPAVETVAIQCPKNKHERWIINLADFDPSVHVAWGEETAAVSVSPEPTHADVQPEAERLVPSVEDFVTDDDGTEWVHIINPDNQRARLRIAAHEYNPDTHRLWSEHPRFQVR